MKTPEQIISVAESLSETLIGQRRVINRILKEQDESDRWPILGKFNVTERAIRHACLFERANGCMSNLEYVLFIDNDIGRIVNNLF
jgi:hypothetical protein